MGIKIGIPIEPRLSNNALQKRCDFARKPELRVRVASEQIRRMTQNTQPAGLKAPLYTINMTDLQQAVDAAATLYNANIRN